MSGAGWYLRKAAGGVYGPVDIEILKEWARKGRIAPEDHVSGDREAWEPAPDLPPLEMTWFVELPDGGSYGPANLGAFLDMLKEGELQADAIVRQKPGGAPRTLGSLAAPAAETGAPAEAAPAPETATPAETETAGPPLPDRSVSWQTLALDRDHAEHEMLKWKAMFETENESVRRLQSQLENLQRELERERIDGAAARRHLEGEIEELKKQQADLSQFAAAGDAGLIQGYRELSRTCNLLADQLEGKALELKEAQEDLRLLRKASEERLRLAEDQLARERADADRVRVRLEGLEGAHREIVQSYREMNDRYIRMREQVSGLPPPSKDASGGASAAGAPSGVRLRR